MYTSKVLYISDLDGTLLNKSAKITDYTANKLNLMIEQGLNFSVATARLLDPVRNMLTNLKINVPIILMNGVLIYDIKHEKYIRVNNMFPEVVITIVKAIKKFEISGFMYELNNERFITYHEFYKQHPIPEYIEKRAASYKSICAPNGLSNISPDNIVYFTLINTQERLQPLYDAIVTQPEINLAFYKNIYSDDMWFLEIFSKDASKKNAIFYLKQIYGFEHVVGFGDNHNDLPLFQACDIRVAVDNGIPEIKELADFICDTNDNDGVAKWLENNKAVFIKDK